MVIDPLQTLSASEMARRIREGELSAREALEAHIKQIERVNPTLNAVVATRYDEARREADAADAMRRAGEALPPFHGVPCTIKECFALEGMPQSSGLVHRRDVRASSDATAVKRLRAAGAIPMGVTNVSELCMWMESANPVYGRTNNPYDKTRIVGGSSGGEGAIVGAGGSPFGLGSDIGGSIRMPAFFNGVFGHKPTGGLVPGTGQYPLASGAALRYLTTGPLCRKAEDLYPLLRILAGPDGQDEGCRDLVLQDPDEVRLGDLDVVVVEENGAIDVSRDLREAMSRVADHLASRGARVRRERFGRLKHSLEIWSSMLSAAGGPSFAELMGNGRPLRPVRELARWLRRPGRHTHTLPAIGLALLEKLPARMPRRTRKYVELGLELKQELVDALGPRGVLLYPPYSRPAPRHSHPLLHPFDWVYTGILNMMEFPVTQVPLGLNAEGLPLGIQVGAVHGNDHVTIAVALELERAFGGWVHPETAQCANWSWARSA